MPLTDEQLASLKANEGANVLYIKEDKAIYYAPKRVSPVGHLRPKESNAETNMRVMLREMEKFKADYPGEKVNVVRV